MLDTDALLGIPGKIQKVLGLLEATVPQVFDLNAQPGADIGAAWTASGNTVGTSSNFAIWDDNIYLLSNTASPETPESWTPIYSNNGVIAVSTAQDLRDLVGYTGAVETLGALAEGDGGGGLWLWDSASTTADNLGTVLLPTGHTGAGRRIRQYSTAAADDAWFGATPTTTDVGPIWSAMVAAGVGGIHISGRRAIGTAVGELPEGFQLVGDNNSVAEVEAQADFITPVFTMTGAPDNYKNKLFVENVTFRGWGDTELYKVPWFFLDSVMNVYVRECFFHGSEACQYEALGAWDHWIINTTFNAGGDYNNQKPGVVFGRSLQVDGEQGNGIHWIGSRIERPRYIGLDITNAAQVMLRGKFHGANTSDSPGAKTYPTVRVTADSVKYSSDINFTSCQMSPLNNSSVVELDGAYKTSFASCTFSAAQTTSVTPPDEPEQVYIRFTNTKTWKTGEISVVGCTFNGANQAYDIDATEISQVTGLHLAGNAFSKGVNGDITERHDIWMDPTISEEIVEQWHDPINSRAFFSIMNNGQLLFQQLTGTSYYKFGLLNGMFMVNTDFFRAPTFLIGKYGDASEYPGTDPDNEYEAPRVGSGKGDPNTKSIDWPIGSFYSQVDAAPAQPVGWIKALAGASGWKGLTYA